MKKTKGFDYKPLTPDIGAHRAFSFIFPVQWIYASRRAQSIWSEKSAIHFLFFITLCPWDALSHKIVSLASRRVCVRCDYYRAHYAWRLEIELNADSASEREGAENKEVFLIYGDKKKGFGEAWPRREGSPSLFCMHGGFCGRRSWQGAAVLPPAFRQQLLRKKRRPEGAATRLALSPSLFSPVCLSLSPNWYTPDTRANTLPSAHIPLSMTHTHTQFRSVCTGDSYVIGRLPRAQRRALKINQVKLNFRWNLCC